MDDLRVRVFVRVSHTPEIDLFLGGGGGWEGLGAEGDYVDEVTDESSGEVSLERVGTIVYEASEWDAEVSLTPMHWLTPRVSLSANVGVPIYTRTRRCAPTRTPRSASNPASGSPSTSCWGRRRVEVDPQVAPRDSGRNP